MLDTLLSCEILDLGSMRVDEELIPLVAIAGGLLFAIVCVCMGAIKSIASNRAREASRREIAAYVAEGTMTAEEGERLLSAGRHHHRERWHC